MTYLDHFSEKSLEYLQFRPSYPSVLFDFLSNLIKHHDCAWDCGTGNGQAAIALSERFKKVIATDLNQAQLDVAPKKYNIEYYCSPAEKTNLPASSIDLITVATALHWFNLPLFYQEVKRVAKPDGIIAAWCYSLGKVSPKIDELIKELYHQLPWPPERHYLDEKYRTILFPFEKLETPAFIIQKNLSFNQFIGYLSTWSAVKEQTQQSQQNPIERMMPRFKMAWDDIEKKQIMTWPIHLLVGRTNTFNLNFQR